MAADKLQVLRRDKEIFDVLILPKDLKVFNKDKRDQLLLNYNEEDDRALVEAEELLKEEEASMEQRITQQSSEETPSQPKPKRRKKASNLSRQANRRNIPGAELSWIGNLAKNRRL